MTRHKALRRASLFQFQNGAIKSKNGFRCFPNYANFNSKMVRLKVRQQRVNKEKEIDFNSKMVRLKELLFLL